MTLYFNVLFDDEGVFGVAREVYKGDLFTLPDIGLVREWQPLTLELAEGEFADYLANDLGCRLCSERLKEILQDSASSDDELQWLSVNVRYGTERRIYWILHFPNPPDILNKDKSIFADDFVVKPVLSKDLIGQHQVFSYPGGGELPLFITHLVKRAFEQVKCSGMELTRAAIQ